MDPFAGNNQDPQSLHKYTYCHANPVNGIDPSGLMTFIGQLAITGIMSGLTSIAFDVVKNAISNTKTSIGGIILNACIAAAVGIIIGPLAGRYLASAINKVALLINKYKSLTPVAKFLKKIVSSPQMFQHALAFTRALISTTSAYFQARANGNSPSIKQMGMLFFISYIIAFYGSKLTSESTIDGINDDALNWLRGRQEVYKKVVDLVNKNSAGELPNAIFNSSQAMGNISWYALWDELIGAMATSESLVASMLVGINSIFQKASEEAIL